MKRAVMVWGTSSGAGKSLLATALCRWAAQRGIDVAPFKAQNMSNNARVVTGPDGTFGEIGSAQYFQALAARVTPTVDMNPVLLKPERDTASQVVLRGHVADVLSELPWRARTEQLAVVARESFINVSSKHELVVIEGAGSPAEINLATHDYVNLGTADWARDAGQLTSLVVTDIDRGGAFAHLYGTWALLPDRLKPTLAGFVLNKFRGDPTLLAPGPAQLEALTTVPIVGVLPMWRDHGLPDEDGVFEAGLRHGDGPHVAIVTYPRISNVDEFQVLRQVPGLRITWARSPAQLDDVDWIILPGSKQVSGDLRWLRDAGLERVVVRHAEAGKPMLGICGGLQMLGAVLSDPEGRDGEAGTVDGLGLLPLGTSYVESKRVLPAEVRFANLRAPWLKLGGVKASAYEIRSGITGPMPGSEGAVADVMRDADGAVIGWQRGSILGLYAHGLFESTSVMRALFGIEVKTLDDTFDGLAEWIDGHFTEGFLEQCLTR